jgi:hypothetical protein
MTKTQSNEAIIISALLVAGIYGYRRATEGAKAKSEAPKPKAKGASPKQLAQPFTGEEIAPLGRFITGWGFAYLVISVMGAASPGLGGWFAILLGTGSVLGNGLAVTKDLNTALGSKETGKKAASPASSAKTTKPTRKGKK